MAGHSVELVNVTKIYSQKNHQKKTACSEINFYADKGQITGILGKNGAGKSTLIKCICAFQYPTEGSVCVEGYEDGASIRKITGYVCESPILEKNMTVKEILHLTSSLYINTVSERGKYITESIRITDIKDILNFKISALSKGYTQRVNLARALCCNPKVLVLDEYSGGLDPLQAKRLRTEIKKLSADKTIIFSTHNIEEAELLCDRLYILKDGRVSCSGSIEELLKNTASTNLEEAFLKCTGEES
ncbi:ABC transporter ATP-binding protein [Treponema sp.]|uniref:ABC transporter ATP-binding protein n=1 Tax=Treponema sp. TaxID=166 RepID=UPI0025FFFA44|nr:ABC transporter ATP-binding protein [Treponema sp.]MCR5217977.1 ABC transporter ATP-binding protein [Treponema sp.]